MWKMILKIIIIAIICIFISSCLKQYNAEFGNIVSVCGGVIIFVLICDELSNIVNFLINLNEYATVDNTIIKLLLKIVGIGYISEFTADIAEDFGNKVIASKVILGGKVVICGMTIPVIKELLSMLFSFLS